MTGEVVSRGHLGGYVTGGDKATWYPGLWRWLVEGLQVGSVLDVGCGEGHALRFFSELGVVAVGIEGVAQNDTSIVQHDFTDGPIVLPNRFNLGWCCEVVEHIEERYLPNLLSAFETCDRVLLTFAEPGQPGYHHVNCRPADYWRGALAGVGLLLDERLTVATRCIAGLEVGAWNHFARSGLAFARPDLLLPELPAFWDDLLPAGVHPPV